MSIHHRDTFSGIGRSVQSIDAPAPRNTSHGNVIEKHYICGENKIRRSLIRRHRARSRQDRSSGVCFRFINPTRPAGTAGNSHNIYLLVSPSFPSSFRQSTGTRTRTERDSSRRCASKAKPESRIGGGERNGVASHPPARDIFRYVNKYKVDRRVSGI